MEYFSTTEGKLLLNHILKADNLGSMVGHLSSHTVYFVSQFKATGCGTATLEWRSVALELEVRTCTVRAAGLLPWLDRNVMWYYILIKGLIISNTDRIHFFSQKAPSPKDMGEGTSDTIGSICLGYRLSPSNELGEQCSLKWCHHPSQ